DVNRSMAEQFGMEVYDDLTGYYAPSEVFKMLPYSFVKKHTLLPIKEEENLIVVAVSDPLNLDPLEEIRMLLGREVKAVYSPREMIELAIGERYDAETGAASEFIASLAKGRGEGKDDEVEVYDLFDT